MNTPSHPPTQGNPRTYVLHPFPPVALTLTDPDPMAAAKTPLTATVPSLPPRQPLPTGVIDPAKPMLKLGLDVHLQRMLTYPLAANPHLPPLHSTLSTFLRVLGA